MELMELDPAVAATLYTPLKAGQIRLAKLEPGIAQTPISVSLMPVDIDSHPEYDAVSYVWGNPKNTLPICCNGMSTDITVNLHWALARVRLPDRSRLVWADALCISQRDLQERNHQVGLMGRIYSGARLVLVCLGEAPNNGAAQEVASLLNDYGPMLARPQVATNLPQLWQTVDPPTTGRDPRWRALGAVLTVPWFGRAWVLQEVGLAKNPRTLYGPVEFGYRDLMATVGWIRSFAGDFAVTMGIGGFLIHTQWADWSKTPDHARFKLVDLLDHGALLDCQDPRDRIFAFLSHPLASNHGVLTPNYTMSKLQIYKEATLFLLNDAGIRVLSSVEHDDSTLFDGFPTWVIRWDVSSTLNNIFVHPETRFSADKGSIGQIQVKENVLYLKGVVVDVVEVVFEIVLVEESIRVEFRQKSAGIHLTILEMASLLEDPKVPSSYTNPPVENLLHTLCCESNSQKTALLRNLWADYCKSRYMTHAQRNWDNVHSLWAMIAGMSRGRSFVVTKKGLYGLAPRVAARGDLCCVIYGSTVPFMMRPVPSTTGSEAFKLLGETYAHGCMHGEVVTMRNRGALKDQLFAVI